jgi:hypothetical protein
MVQLGLKKHTTRKKQHMCRMMIMLCQWDFNEQIEKLVSLSLCTSKNCSRKFQAWLHSVPSVSEGYRRQSPYATLYT